MGDPIYAYEVEWVGVVEGKQPTTFSIKTRRQAEINWLIKHSHTGGERMHKPTAGWDLQNTCYTEWELKTYWGSGEGIRKQAHASQRSLQIIGE